jgi:hypothetical protein
MIKNYNINITCAYIILYYRSYKMFGFVLVSIIVIGLIYCYYNDLDAYAASDEEDEHIGLCV